MLLLGVGCDRLPEERCGKLRGEAFDLLNGSHACMEDADCTVSHWPGCPKPINLKIEAQVEKLRDRFVEGSCERHQKRRHAAGLESATGRPN